MPGGDRTGPDGKGPRGLGKAAGNNMGRGSDQAQGQKQGRGQGQGQGKNR